MQLQNNTHIDRSYRIARLLAMLLIVGQFVYFAVIEILLANSTGNSLPLNSQLPLLKSLFYSLAVILVFISAWLRNRLLGGGAVLQQMVPQILDPQTRQKQMVKAVQIAMTIAGIPGILAIVLFLLGGNRVDCYPLLAIALLGQVRLYPRRRDWERWYAQRNAFR